MNPASVGKNQLVFSPLPLLKLEIPNIISLYSILSVLILKGYINAPAISLDFSSSEIEMGSSKFSTPYYEYLMYKNLRI